MTSKPQQHQQPHRLITMLAIPKTCHSHRMATSSTTASNEVSKTDISL